MGALVDVNEVRTGASLTDCLGGGDEGVRHGDYDVSGFHTRSCQSKANSVRSAGDTDTIGRIAEFGKIPLEFLYLRPSDESGRLQSFSEGRQQFPFERLVKCH